MASSNGGVPPGFRFHPTEEELLHYYLKKKVTFQKFELEVIREVNLNKMEPWDLQERCTIGATPQNEWYFFSHKDRKYPTGSRTNRATNAGFWKATGRDKCIRNSDSKIGMRKTLVFYRGRAPHGHKTDWIMHEYRLEENDDEQTNAIEDGWVICRVFKQKKLFKVSNIERSSSLYAVGHHPSPRAIANYQQALTLGDHHADHGQHGDMQTFQEHGLHHYHPLFAPNDSNTGQIHLHCRGDGPRPPSFYDFPALTGDQSSPAMIKQLLATMGRESESDPAQQMVIHGREEAGLSSDWPCW